ncbi:Transposable element P transposase [Orchesella cincta]|uniref:Transposable element P transposase n=1 Tax=Orchesella cincta TaxID=48709 RepID=A0A1D2M914_ORCCI|nr:Transposable element P transposase [Orchesella cincta]
MTKKFKGYIDYADFTEYAKERKSPKCEADHCLVFLIRFFNSKITQPIACFATRGAAAGNILAKMVISAIVRLENIGLQVVGFVSDGAATNKSMWRELGITTKRGSGIVNSITNPVDEGRQVFFLCDIPHILKCIRNNFYNKENVKVFSNSTANGLKAYREIGQNNFFQKSEPTENFTRLLNDLFDACNGRIPMDGLRPENAKYKIIEDFLAAMSPSDTYASDQTFVSLQVTLTSLLELTHYCVTSLDIIMFWLENVINILWKLLSVYFPTSRSIKGNVSKDEEYAVVTVSCIDTLKSLRNVAKTEHERNNKLLEDTLLSKIFYSQDQPMNIVQQINEDHGYSIPPISRCIVYQFSGFLAYKGKAFTKCVDCIESLIDRNPNTHDMRLTAMKDFGGLKYPSQALFNMNDTLNQPYKINYQVLMLLRSSFHRL